MIRRIDKILCTFEMNLKHNKKDKRKMIALQAKVKQQTNDEDNDGSDMARSLTILIRKFGKLLNKDELEDQPTNSSFLANDKKRRFSIVNIVNFVTSKLNVSIHSKR